MMIEPYLLDLADTIAKISRWASWCNRLVGRRTCGSAEKYYRPPSDFDRAAGLVTDQSIADIIAVDNAWRETDNRRYRLFLAWYYVDRKPRRLIAKHLAIRSNDTAWPAFHRAAVLEIHRRVRERPSIDMSLNNRKMVISQQIISSSYNSTTGTPRPHPRRDAVLRPKGSR